MTSSPLTDSSKVILSTAPGRAFIARLELEVLGAEIQLVDRACSFNVAAAEIRMQYTS